MYAAHFGLTERPFSLAPDPRYLFLSEGHREALAHLVYGLQSGGFVQLTGEVGTGKTTVCRALLDQLPPDVDAAMIFSPRLTAGELLAAICDELRIERPAGPASVKGLIDSLSRALLEAHARGRRTVVIIDEAQNLSMEVLEELRLLTNIETTRDKLLQIILIGQPELADLMGRPALRQLAQRVTARYHLRPFSFGETCAYVRHRLDVAGQRRPLFTGMALRVVHRRSGGVPRLINNICDRALLGAFGLGRKRVTAAVAGRAAAEVFGRPGARRWLEPAATGALAAAIVVGATAFGGERLNYVGAWWAERLVPSPVAAPPRTVAGIAPVTPSASPAVLPRPGAATLLEATTADRDAALARLFALWEADYRPRAGEGPCDVARRAGLRCLVRAGTWNALRRLDLPATLTLTTAAGDRHYATVTALGPGSVTLDVGRPVTLSTAEVERVWDGAFVALWKAPDLAATELRPGDDQPERVRAFQRAHGLTPDGVPGEETLLRLATVTRGPGAPTLGTAAR